MTEFSPRPGVLAVLGVGALLLGGAAYVDTGPGRWLLALAAVGLGAETARGLLLRPALRIGPDGLDVVVGVHREHVPWAALEATGAEKERRRLVASSWLEIDTGDRVLSVPGYRLGAPVAEVAAAIRAAGSAGSAGRRP